METGLKSSARKVLHHALLLPEIGGDWPPGNVMRTVERRPTVLLNSSHNDSFALTKQTSDACTTVLQSSKHNFSLFSYMTVLQNERYAPWNSVSSG